MNIAGNGPGGQVDQQQQGASLRPGPQSGAAAGVQRKPYLSLLLFVTWFLIVKFWEFELLGAKLFYELVCSSFNNTVLDRKF